MTTPMHRAVYDCVVFAQALINPKGPAGECVEQARIGRVQLFISGYLLDEIRELPGKLPARYGVSLEHAAELAAELLLFADYVDQVPAIYTHPHDPDDSHYINLACVAAAKLIVSRDRHLLNLMDANRPEALDFRHRFPDLAILSPEVFARQLRAEAVPRPDRL